METKKIDFSNEIPRHIAIIMDGNGRWAKKRFLPRVFGHIQGTKTVKDIVRASDEFGVEVLTLYAFSTENWKRPSEEINSLFGILSDFLKKEFKELVEKKVKLRILGDLSKFPQRIQKEIKEVLENTKDNNGLQLNIALNYGARQELLRAFKNLIDKGVKEPSENDISDNLYTARQPDPDLVIRTSGEMRVSNFLLWQIAYSEIYITDKLWPDFNKDDLQKAIADFQKRQRRFGAV
ncbi:MAG: isoprenyl transferase [Elusimicrobiota bacterium]|nr:isoprenyl transferase [Elusimicrobiota bacterium]